MKGERLALLIAQERYQRGTGLTSLDAPVSGALALGDALRSCGFAVTTIGTEPGDAAPLGVGDLLTGLEAFACRAETSINAAVFFYFAGHGVMHGDDYYLLSERANVQQFRSGGIDLSRIVKRLRRTDDGITFIMTDACRVHPYPEASRALRDANTQDALDYLLMREPMALRRGLIASAAGDGQTILDDGGQGVSLFTAAVIKALRERNLSASEVFHIAQEEVFHATEGRQRPSLLPQNGSHRFIFHENRVGDISRTPLQAQSKAVPLRSSVLRETHTGPIVSVVGVGARKHWHKSREYSIVTV
jgi:hypothetical protein